MLKNVPSLCQLITYDDSHLSRIEDPGFGAGVRGPLPLQPWTGPEKKQQNIPIKVNLNITVSELQVAVVIRV